MPKRGYFAIPNEIITDEAMYPSTKRVLCAMLAYSSRHSTIRKSLKELGRLSGCSEATVRKALAELERGGIVQRVRCFRYSCALSRPVYAKNEYRLVREKLRGSYTLVPRELLAAEVSHATFAVALYLYKTAGRTGRSWPSLRTVAKRTDLSKATICRALEALRRAQLLVRYFCVMANRAHSCNSYYPTAWVRPRQRDGARQGQTVFSLGGGLKFTQHPVINKIARAFIRRKREKGVCQFGNLHSFFEKDYSQDALPVFPWRTVPGEKQDYSALFHAFASTPNT